MHYILIYTNSTGTHYFKYKKEEEQLMMERVNSEKNADKTFILEKIMYGIEIEVIQEKVIKYKLGLKKGSK